jgi:hypothetical protein
MKEEDISKLVIMNAWIYNLRENKLKSAITLLQRLGVEGETLSILLLREPRLLMVLEEKVLESFKVLEDFGIQKESKMFVVGLHNILGVRK